MAEVQITLRVDKQQHLEGMCMELEAANSQGNSRQFFHIVKSVTRKFQYWTECREYCVAIWETGEWPEEWTLTTFIPLPKKGDLKQCANYQTIGLVSHASKILLRIILERIRVKTETEIADEQVGFRQGREMRDKRDARSLASHCCYKNCPCARYCRF